MTAAWKPGVTTQADILRGRLRNAEQELTSLRTALEALATTWESDSMAGDRYCAKELRDVLAGERP